jgi:hypothetical protein
MLIRKYKLQLSKNKLILPRQKINNRVIKVRLAAFIVLSLISGHLIAQMTGTRFIKNLQSPGSSGSVTIVQSDEITKLIDRHLYEEGKKKGISGYRLVIFSKYGQSARAEADRAMALFIRNYPDNKAYFTFDYPDYKIYVGDFRTRSEAYKFQKIIEKDFPNAYFRPIRINYPNL